MSRPLARAVTITCLTGLVIAGAPLAASSASASSVAKAETVTIVFSGAPGRPGTVHARGAVTDNGKLTPADGNVDTFVFKDGTLRIRETLKTKVGYPKPPLCVTTFRSSGVVRVVGGTGRFAGASGTGTASDTGLTVGRVDSCGSAPLFVSDKATLHFSLTL